MGREGRNVVLYVRAFCSFGNTMWLDPLVQREWLPNVEQWVQNFNVRSLLLEQSFAVANPQVSVYVSIRCFVV